VILEGIFNAHIILIFCIDLGKLVLFAHCSAVVALGFGVSACNTVGGNYYSGLEIVVSESFLFGGLILGHVTTGALNGNDLVVFAILRSLDRNVCRDRSIKIMSKRIYDNKSFVLVTVHAETDRVTGFRAGRCIYFSANYVMVVFVIRTSNLALYKLNACAVNGNVVRNPVLYILGLSTKRTVIVRAVNEGISVFRAGRINSYGNLGVSGCEKNFLASSTTIAAVPGYKTVSGAVCILLYNVFALCVTRLFGITCIVAARPVGMAERSNGVGLLYVSANGTSINVKTPSGTGGSDSDRFIVLKGMSGGFNGNLNLFSATSALYLFPALSGTGGGEFFYNFNVATLGNVSESFNGNNIIAVLILCNLYGCVYVCIVVFAVSTAPVSDLAGGGAGSFYRLVLGKTVYVHTLGKDGNVLGRAAFFARVNCNSGLTGNEIGLFVNLNGAIGPGMSLSFKFLFNVIVASRAGSDLYAAFFAVIIFVDLVVVIERRNITSVVFGINFITDRANYQRFLTFFGTSSRFCLFFGFPIVASLYFVEISSKIVVTVGTLIKGVAVFAAYAGYDLHLHFLDLSFSEETKSVFFALSGAIRLTCFCSKHRHRQNRSDHKTCEKNS